MSDDGAATPHPHLPLPLTCSVPDFGALVFNHKSGNPSYEAAQAGVIPTIEYGFGDQRKRKVVPIRRALKDIAGNDPTVLEHVTRDFAVKWNALVEARKEKRRHG